MLEVTEMKFTYNLSKKEHFAHISSKRNPNTISHFMPMIFSFNDLCFMSTPVLHFHSFSTFWFGKLQTDAVLTTEASQQYRLQQNFSSASTQTSSPISRWRLNSDPDRRDHEGFRADRTTEDLKCV